MVNEQGSRVMGNPIFIGGMFKSGTTLLRAMLGQHSNIASGLETYWFDLDRQYFDGGVDERMVKKFTQYFDIREDDVKTMFTTSSSSEQFLDMLLTYFAVRNNKSRWAEKTPGNISHMDRIFDYWPQAKFIHIVRDPRDVYASLVEAKKWDTPEEFADRWVSTIGVGIRMRDIMNIPSDLYIEIRYESLIRTPEAVMRRLLNFLDEQWEEAVSIFQGRATDYEKVKSVTGKYSTTLERLKFPISDNRVGVWNRILSESQVKSIRERVHSKGLA